MDTTDAAQPHGHPVGGDVATATAGSAAGLAASGFHGCDGNAVSAHGSGAQEAQSGSSLGLATAHADVPRVTASTALEMVGLGRFHWQLLLVAGSGWAADGMWEEIAPLLLPQVEKEWPGVSSTVLGVLVAAQFAGMAIGSVGWGVLSDRVGRRLPFRYILLVSGVSGTLAALSPSWWTLMLFLFVNGVGIGGNIPCDGAMFIEYAPAAKRGSMIALLSLMYTSGSLLATAVAWALLPNVSVGGWRVMTVACGVVTMLLAALRTQYAETPIFLYEQGRLRAARASIDTVIAANTAGHAESSGTFHAADERQPRVRPAFRLVPTHEALKARHSVAPVAGSVQAAMRRLSVDSRPHSGAGAGAGADDGTHELSEQLTAHDSQQAVLALASEASGQTPAATRTSDVQLLSAGADTPASQAVGFAAFWGHVRATPLLQRSALLLWTAWFTGVFGFIGLNSFLLIVLERRGIFSDQDLYKDTFIYAVAGLGGAIAGVFLVESRLGRRGTMVASTGLATLLLFAAGAVSSDFLVVLFAALSNCCFQAMFAGLTTYTPEVFPTVIRTTGTGVANMSARVAGMMSPLVCGALLDVSEGAVLVLCGSLMAATATCAAFLPIETRGRVLA